jgi:Flp pilus assembly protein TadG
MSSKMMGKAHKMDHLLKHFGRSENGMILIWVAVLLPVLFGFTALAVDAAYLYAYKSRSQAAADAAALAGVYLVEDGTPTEVTTAGNAAARANIPDNASGIDISAISIQRGVWDCTGITYPNTCFSAVTDADDATAVRAQVAVADAGASGLNLFFAKAIGFSEQGVGAEAVANLYGGGPPENCLIALEPLEASAFYVNGVNDISAEDCNFHINSNHPTAAAEVNGGAADVILTGGDFNVNGAYSGKLTVIDPDPTEGVPQVSDPYIELNPINDILDGVTSYTYNGTSYTYGNDAYLGDGTAAPNFTCTPEGTLADTSAATSVTAGTTIDPGVYCGGLNDNGSGGGTVTMSSGTYVIVDGSLDINNVLLQGAGPVTIVVVDTNMDAVEDAYVQATGNGGFDLEAPTDPTNPFAGFLIWAARSNPESTSSEEWKIAGTIESTFNGAIYTPGALWSFRGDVNTSVADGNDCFLLITDKVEFKGGTNTTFGADGCGGYSGTPLFTDDVYALVE